MVGEIYVRVLTRLALQDPYKYHPDNALSRLVERLLQ